jgi:protease-4
VRKVASGRKLAIEAAEAAAKGRLWIGAHAREQGLVDELGDVDRAIELARELSRRRAGDKLPVEDVVVAPRRRNLLARLLLSRLDTEAQVPAPLGEILDLLAVARERVLLLAELLPRWE